jgi:hypothetical protein
MKIDVLGTFRIDGRTYEQSMVSCGKKGCRCMKGGDLHGPYWYRRYTQGGVHRRRYIGRQLLRDSVGIIDEQQASNTRTILEDGTRDFLKEAEAFQSNEE